MGEQEAQIKDSGPFTLYSYIKTKCPIPVFVLFCIHIGFRHVCGTFRFDNDENPKTRLPISIHRIIEERSKLVSEFFQVFDPPHICLMFNKIMCILSCAAQTCSTNYSGILHSFLSCLTVLIQIRSRESPLPVFGPRISLAHFRSGNTPAVTERALQDAQCRNRNVSLRSFSDAYTDRK